MSRVFKALGMKLHPKAHCEEEGCGFWWSSSDIARDLAKDHVKQTGHTVLVETITVDRYRREDWRIGSPSH